MKKPKLGIVFGVLHFLVWCAIGLSTLSWLNAHHQKFLVWTLPVGFVLWIGLTFVSHALFNWLLRLLTEKTKSYPPEVTVKDNGWLEVDAAALVKTPEGKAAIEKIIKELDDEITREVHGKWPR